MTKFVHEPDDGAILPAAQPAVPQTLGGLLGRLRVVGQPEDAQRDAVRTWLETNQPPRFVRDQLADRGWLPADRRRVA